MDYQTSSGRKVMRLVCISCALVFLVAGFSAVYAQLVSTSESVTITAIVPTPSLPPTNPPSSGGGGGGGGGGVPLNNANGSDTAVFKGLAYPGSIVTLLKNGVVAAEVPASPNGTFEIQVRNLPSGTYTFGIRAEDADRLRSTLDVYTIYVSSGITTVVDGIFIPPTITTDKIEVKRGDPIILLGKAAPKASVTLTIHSETELIKKTTSDVSGAWLYKLDSSELEIGQHESRARSVTSDDLSAYSDTIEFKVGSINRTRSASSAIPTKNKCDLNNDARVNILDYSIMAYWYKRTGFPVRVDLNTDGKINLVDFSILAYCWTG